MERTYNVLGMHCISCSTGIAKIVKRLKGVSNVRVELSKSKIHVDLDENLVTDQAVIDAVSRLGYKAQPES